MSRKTWSLIGAIVVVLIVGGAAIYALTGLAGSNGEREYVATETGNEINPVATDADIAAKSALTRGFTWTPATQDSDLDGFVAAADITTERFHEKTQQAADEQPAQALPEQWESWAASGDEVRPIITVDSHQVDTAGRTAAVSATVEQEVHHQDGDTTPFSRFTVTANMVATDGSWLLDTYEIINVEY